MRLADAYYLKAGYFDLTLVARVLFIENTAGNRGGAIWSLGANLLDVDGAIFKSNKANRGGAAGVETAQNINHVFSECFFEDNEALDGGAVYLHQGPGVHIVNASVFRGNYARKSPICP